MFANIPNIGPSDNREELIARLQQIPTSVPPRGRGRTKKHTECYTLCRLLSTLAAADALPYPISVQGHDKPDAIVCAGASKIGVEVTEAVTEGFAYLTACWARLCPGKSIPVTPALTKRAARELLKACKQAKKDESETPEQEEPRTALGDGWTDGEAERQWADYIITVAHNKLAKLASPNFEKFEKNWLLIYDNLPLPSVDLGRAILILTPLLRDFWNARLAFDNLFVVRTSRIVKITRSGSAHFAVNDVWATDSSMGV
jgi:hypothetical protein